MSAKASFGLFKFRETVPLSGEKTSVDFVESLSGGLACRHNSRGGPSITRSTLTCKRSHPAEIFATVYWLSILYLSYLC